MREREPEGRTTSRWSSSARISSATSGRLPCLRNTATTVMSAASFAWSSTCPDPGLAPDWPYGIELRLLEVDRDGEAVHAAIEEAFAEEWGYRQRSYEEWRKRAFDWRGLIRRSCPWRGRVTRSPAPRSTTPSAWVTGVGRLHRRSSRVRGCGLGLALLRESFERFRQTGETTVALGVDAQNATERPGSTSAPGCTSSTRPTSGGR